MNLETKRIETMKKYLIFNISGFLLLLVFQALLLLFILNLIELWIILVEFGVAIPCWILSYYFRHKLIKIYKEIDYGIDCN